MLKKIIEPMLEKRLANDPRMQKLQYEEQVLRFILILKVSRN